VTDRRWQPGDHALLRYRRRVPGEVMCPVTVVEDTPDLVALYTAPGTPIKGQATVNGQRLTRATSFLERERMVTSLADDTWTENHTLQLIRPGEPRATWLIWREGDWQHRAYYVNLQAPLKRTHLGFDTADYLLDLDVTPDLSWSWKDEEEVAIAREHGIVAPAILDRMRDEGERAIRDIEERAWPFDAGYETWRPNPAWTIPRMPDGWDDGLHEPFVPDFASNSVIRNV
jgi:uncharacterized protein DUF402